MSTNSHHASFQTKDYKWKDFNHGPTRDLTSEKSVETPNPNFPYHASRNSPLSSMNQNDLRKDKNSTSNEPLQVKHIKNHQQYENQQQYHESPEEESEENDIPHQPIINERTLLALEYLQKSLLPNKILQQEKNVSSNPIQDGNSEGFHSRNESNERDGKEYKLESKNAINELNKRAKDSSYLTNSDKYERSRSRSNEKNEAYDRRTIQRNNYDERYKLYKNKGEEEISQQDWECLNCRALNWARRDNCSQCGDDRIENHPREINKNKSLDFNKDQYYKGDNKRSDYRNTSIKNVGNNFSLAK